MSTIIIVRPDMFPFCEKGMGQYVHAKPRAIMQKSRIAVKKPNNICRIKRGMAKITNIEIV